MLLGVLCGMLAFGGCGRAQHFPRSPAALEDELPRLEGVGGVLERVEVFEGDGVETGSEHGCEVSGFCLGFGGADVLEDEVEAAGDLGPEHFGETFVASVGEDEREGGGEEEAEEDEEDGRGSRGESMGVLVAARGAGNFVRELAAPAAGVVAFLAMGTRFLERLSPALTNRRILSLLDIAPARAGRIRGGLAGARFEAAAGLFARLVRRLIFRIFPGAAHFRVLGYGATVDPFRVLLGPFRVIF